jgi:hypothetical protein
VYNNGATNAQSAGPITVTDTRIRCENENNWCLTLGPGSTVSDSEVGGGADGQTFIGAIGVLTGNWSKGQALTTITRVNVHHVVQGFRIDGDTTLTDSYLHDVVMGDPPLAGAHSEDVFTTAGSNITIQHNTMSYGNTACLFVQCETGNVPIGTFKVTDNQFIGVTHLGEQSSFGVDIENKDIAGPITVANNVFTLRPTWQVGPAQAPAGTSNTGNTYTDGTTAPVYTS